MKVTLVMAQTLDGSIGRDADHFPDWTGRADKRFFAQFTKEVGVVIMGSKTFDTFGTPLPNRSNVILTRDPKRVSSWDNLIYTSKQPLEILDMLKRKGFRQVVLAGGATINSLFAKAGLIDEIIVTIAPKIFGKGLKLFDDTITLELELMDLKRLDHNRVVLSYRVQNSKAIVNENKTT